MSALETSSRIKEKIAEMALEENLDGSCRIEDEDLEKNSDTINDQILKAGLEEISDWKSGVKEPRQDNSQVDFKIDLGQANTTGAEILGNSDSKQDLENNGESDANVSMDFNEAKWPQTRNNTDGSQDANMDGSFKVKMSTKDKKGLLVKNKAKNSRRQMGSKHVWGGQIMSEKSVHVDFEDTQWQDYALIAEHSPLWVKWRGKWQAGIRCSMEDCPAATMNAKPTYSRKIYIVVFFPSTHSFVWTDGQLADAITQSPEPLAFGSHERGRNSVSDLHAARHYMLWSITRAMLDISDRLPLLAVRESARDVSVWKEFAKEAAKVVKYSELGVMLVKLGGMILPIYLKEPWMHSCYKEWEQQCRMAKTASSLEELIREFKNAVSWDKVGKIWDESEQTNLDSEWKTWKEDAQHKSPNEYGSDWNSTPTGSSYAGFRANRKLGSPSYNHNWDENHGCAPDSVDSGLDMSRKRLKLEAHCSGPQQEVKLLGSEYKATSSLTKRQGAIQMKNLILDDPAANTGILQMQNTSKSPNSKDLTSQDSLATLSAVSPIPRSLMKQNLQTLHSEPKLLGSSVHCSVFSERNGRQCSKYVNEGSSYCCEHETKENKSTSVIPVTVTDGMNSLICNGTTKPGRRCTHKTREGSSFCLKHMLQDVGGTKVETKGLEQISPPRKFRRVESKSQAKEAHGLYCEKLQGNSNRKKTHSPSVTGLHGQHDAGSNELTLHGKLNNRTVQWATNWTRCIGRCRVSGGQCSHRAKPGLSYCEKHLPGSSAYRAKDLKEHALMEAFPAECMRNSIVEDEQDLLRARDLLHEYMKACLPESVERVGQLSRHEVRDRILLEVSNNTKATEALFNLVTAEKESLERILKRENTEQTNSFISPDVPKPVDSTGASLESPGDLITEQDLPSASPLGGVNTPCNEQIQNYRCKLCPQEFVELVVLSQHWRASHKKEVHQLFRGYACQHCTSSFTNKKGLQKHWSVHHSEVPFASSSLLAVLCIICSGSFGDFEGLWQHVILSHPDSLKFSRDAAGLNVKCELGGLTSQTSIGQEVAEVIRCSCCSMAFMTSSDLQEHEEVCHKKSSCSAEGSHKEEVERLVPFAIGNKFKCKICGLRFRLLPDIGRHYQTEHKSVCQRKSSCSAEGSHKEEVERLVPSANGNKFKCKICGLRFRFLPDIGRHYQIEHKSVQTKCLSTGREEGKAVHLCKEPNSSIVPQRERKRLQKLDVQSNSFQSKVEKGNLQPEDQMWTIELYDTTVADIDGHKGPKVPSCPTNKDILAVARIACCKIKLHNLLGKKYATLPERLPIKAAKLCSEASVRLQWHRQGYTCPNACREYVPSLESRLVSLETSFPRVNLVPFQYTLPCNGEVANCEQRYQGGEIFLDENHLVLTIPLHTDELDSKCMVLCKDISFGQEMVPIPCIIDRDVLEPCICSLCVENQGINHADSLRSWGNFSYVRERLLDPSLRFDTKSPQLGCSCKESQCSSDKCSHVYLFDNHNNDALDIYGNPMYGRFPYDNQGCIILEEGYLVYECSSSCGCQEDCPNRVLQKGVQVRLEVCKTRHKGWAVRASQLIARGTFVCEYVGEVINDQEANKRYDQEGCSYLYDIGAHIDTDLSGRTKPFVVDATKYGNVARFINHSCLPNLVNYQVLVESMDCQLAHIGLYASRDIEFGEELTYDYRYNLLPGKGCQCHCGSKNCRGRLY